MQVEFLKKNSSDVCFIRGLLGRSLWKSWSKEVVCQHGGGFPIETTIQ